MVFALVGTVSFLSLELLFILAHDPSRYPVNGLSRLTIAYVPLTIWYAASTSSGLLTFLHADRFWHVLAMAVLGGVLFRTTGHPGATPAQNTVWTMVGILAGFQAGLLGAMLPLAMPMQGLVASFILCVPLRARRYVYAPHPTSRQAWIEGMAAGTIFLLSLVTAKWL